MKRNWDGALLLCTLYLCAQYIFILQLLQNTDGLLSFTVISFINACVCSFE